MLLEFYLYGASGTFFWCHVGVGGWGCDSLQVFQTLSVYQINYLVRSILGMVLINKS